MILNATHSENNARLRGELRLGLALNTEHGAIWAIENLSAARYHALQELGEELQVVLSGARALNLRLSHDPSCDVALKLPADYPFEKLQALADPSMDLDYPGKGPLAQGEFPTAFKRNLLDFMRSARTLPAAIAIKTKLPNAMTLALPLPTDAIKSQIKAVSQARVPLKLANEARVQVYRSLDLDEEHYAVIIGNQSHPTPLVRVHSACFTGDCLGSLKCDCGPQLHAALKALEVDGGILLYLSQEGRGIGMANKMRAYKLQDQGFDTVEANQRLGFADDAREFGIAAEMLFHLRKPEIRLMTNNPRKISMLETAGIIVRERVPLQIKPSKDNAGYLATKADKSGHLL